MIKEGEERKWILPSGLLHRESGPAVYYGGNKYWFLFDKVHRESGSAVFRNDGSVEYYLNNIRYSKENYNEKMAYRIAKKQTLKDNYAGYNLGRYELAPGFYHRKNRPAYKDKQEEKWYLYGVLHRENGPALTNKHEQIWYINGEMHRENGPAFISYIDLDEWRLNGDEFSESEFKREIRKRKLNKILR